MNAAPEGYEWRWEFDKGWAASPRSTGRCRFAVGPTGQACGAPAVASLNRGSWRLGRGHSEYRRFDQWWDYCGEHLYGRKLVDFNGLPAVVHRVLRPVGGVPDDFAWLDPEARTEK